MDTNHPNIAGFLDDLAEKSPHIESIMFAAESGSRMWGIDSKDSDYDPRYIYLAPFEYHITAFGDHKVTVIEMDEIDPPTGKRIDSVGWEFAKAIYLAWKSNENLREWLSSPMVYKEPYPAIEELREFLKRNFSPRSSAFHYYSMGRGHYYRYITPLSTHEDADISYKKYLYTLRSLLCSLWCIKYETPPPISFPALVSASIHPKRDDNNANTLHEITELLNRKRAGELASGPRLPYIENFLERCLDAIDAGIHNTPSVKSTTEKRDELDEIYRDVIGQHFFYL